ncbi:MAG: insulinase family protein [Clostridia bacterium]|nr:insulinase family protein [Clostridia bacterium]
MKYQGDLHGFRIVRERMLTEIGALMVEMEYEKTGTPLVYLERRDTNKSFAVTFKTIPDDDTGVFHILEHSVLCGSRKYPVKEPFVELLKGSMQTFLNALTFNDKTMYPVSSRNQKDFLNLIDVYMDAVLHPAILENENIFRQEGWHYELNEKDGTPTFKGVVFNEMKGAYSSADEVAEEEMCKLLYPDTCYGKDSGGNPTVIPTLTYEKFLACHKKYYHPTNARIFLDGEMDLGAVLEKLDGFLKDYDRRPVDTDIPCQEPKPYTEKTVEYEIAEDEDEENKVRLYLGYMGVPFDRQRELLAIGVIGTVLAGSNDAPLNRALLAESLCEDVEIGQNDGIMQTSVTVEVRGTEKEKLPRIREVIGNVLTEAAEKGLDRVRTVATLNSMEFSMRERDFGSTPRGLVYAISALDSWLYGGDPAQNLCFNDSMAFLRENLDTGYFEGLIRKLFLENPHTAALTLVPSKTLAAKRLAEEEKRLSEAAAKWSAEERETVYRQTQDLISWQGQADTEEKLSTLPSLAVSDIESAPESVPLDEREEDGVKILYHDIPTEGITYTDLRFNAADTDEEDLPLLGLMGSLFSRLGTEKHDPLSLQNEIKTWLGALSLSPEIVAIPDKHDRCGLYLRVSAAALDVNRDKIPELLREILLSTEWHDAERIRTVLRQMKSASEDALGSAGHASGISRVSAALTSAGAVAEKVKGYDAYCKQKLAEKNFEQEFEAIAARLCALSKKLFVKERLTAVSHVGQYDAGYLKAVIGALDRGTPCEKELSEIPPLGMRKEGLEIPSQISYAVVGGTIPTYTGAYAVAENLASYEYLWNAVRVQGGAYGTGMIARIGGLLMFYSYRDPSAVRSLGAYRKTAAFLREFLKSGASIDKYIIGAVGSSEPLRTPCTAAAQSDLDYLRGITYEDRKTLRAQMLNTTPEDLLAIADVIEKIADSGAVFVTGGKDKLAEVPELEKILKM